MKECIYYHMKECIYYLLTQKKAAHKCPVQCSLVVYLFLVILFSFVVLAISNYFQSHCFLRLFLPLSVILRQIIDIVMTSK